MVWLEIESTSAKHFFPISLRHKHIVRSSFLPGLSLFTKKVEIFIEESKTSPFSKKCSSCRTTRFQIFVFLFVSETYRSSSFLFRIAYFPGIIYSYYLYQSFLGRVSKTGLPGRFFLSHKYFLGYSKKIRTTSCYFCNI